MVRPLHGMSNRKINLENNVIPIFVVSLRITSYESLQAIFITKLSTYLIKETESLNNADNFNKR